MYSTSKPKPVGKKQNISNAETGKGQGGREKLLLVWQETEN